MTPQEQYIKDTVFVTKINRLLLVILTCMIAGFFAWADKDNLFLIRTIKVVVRMGTLLAVYFVYRKILAYGSVDNLKWKNHFTLIFYIAYLFLAFTSFMWSSDVGYSALQLSMITQSFAFSYFFIKSLYLLDEFFPNHPVRLYNLLGNAAFIMALVMIIGIWVAPDKVYRYTHFQTEARLGGLLMNPNELGMLCCIGTAGLLFDIYRKYNLKWIIVKLIILFSCLFETGSRSSLIGYFVIIMFHVYLFSKPKQRLIIFIAMLILLPIPVNKVILKNSSTDRIEEVLSFTGRIPFWKGLILEGLPNEPLLGYGFMRVHYNDYFRGRHTYPAKMTHNTFIQVLINLGFIGFTIIVFQMIFTFRALSKEDRHKKIMLIGLLVPIIINSFTEFGIFGEANYGILFYQLIIIYISFELNPIITPRDKIFLSKRRPGFFKMKEASIMEQLNL